MIRFAFIGFRHRHIFAAYKIIQQHPETEILGGFEGDQEAREAAANDLGVNFCYGSYEELLADPRVDAVCIGDYYGIRGQRAIQALKAGKHVFADKPLCTSLEELDEIEKLSLEKGLKVAWMRETRHKPVSYAVKQAIDAGEIGKVHQICFTGQHPMQYKKGRPDWYFEEGKHGGTINDIAIHGIDVIEYYLDCRLKRVVGARSWNAFATETPCFKDASQFIVEMADGAMVMADVSYAAPNSCGFKLPFYWRTTIWGTKGVIEYGPATPDAYTIARDGDEGLSVVAVESATVVDGEHGLGSVGVFIDEIKKEGVFEITASCIASTRDTLTIQVAADQNA